MRLTTSDDLSLEAELATPADGTDWAAAVVLAHPHPQQGGSMRSVVTSELFTQLPERSLAVLRFNFRGVGGSEGEYGHGRAEHADIVAALDVVAPLAAERDVPLILAGWSFGADVSLTVIDHRLSGWFLAASPLRILPPEAFVAAHDPRPKWFTVPERDQFRPPDAVRSFTEHWVATEVHDVAGADHFLIGRTKVAVDHLEEFAWLLRELRG